MEISVEESKNTEFVEPRLGVEHQIPFFTEQNQENNRNQQNINLTQGQQNNGSSKSFTETGVVKQSSKSNLSNAAPCRAYEAAELYRRRKEFKLKQIQQEEERLRKVKAKPMPNFKAIHSKALTTVKEPAEERINPETPEVLRRGLAMKEKHNQKVLQALEDEKVRNVKAKPMPNFKAIHSKALTTVKASADGCVSPETPEVLRRGLAMKEKHNQKIKEHELKLSERVPIVARSSKVLQEEPFKPKLEPHHQLKVEPFNLKMNERLEQRKQWDENYQREVAIRKEKEQEQKEKQEARTRQVVREKTTFKARPNPFKKNDNLD